MTFLKQKKFQAQAVTFSCSIGISAQNPSSIVFLLFGGHLTAIFDATKLGGVNKLNPPPPQGYAPEPSISIWGRLLYNRGEAG